MKASGALLFLCASIPLFAAASPEVRDLIESGNSFYRMGLYDEAGKQYLHAAEIDHDSPEVNYNLGNVYHQKFLESKSVASTPNTPSQASAWEAKAVEAYKQAMTSTSPTLRARALFNLGNTYAEAAKREDAITAYQEALRIIPNDEDTKHNLELLLRGKKIPALIPPRQVEELETGKPLTNVVSSGTVKVRMPGSTTTNATGWAESSGGTGAGQAGDQANDSAGGGAQGADQAGGGAGSNATPQAGGGEGAGGNLPGAGGEGGEAAGQKSRVQSSSDGDPDKALKLDETAASGEKGDKTAAKASASMPEKTSVKDKASSASDASEASSPKDQDKSRSDSSASTDQIDPKRKEVLDKASKAEQRYIDQWSRPPDLKKPKEQDW